MNRTQSLLAVLLAFTVGWIVRDVIDKPVSVLPAANAQMLEDVSELLKGRAGSMYLTVSASGEKLVFWRFEEAKAGRIFPILEETRSFVASDLDEDPS